MDAKYLEYTIDFQSVSNRDLFHDFFKDTFGFPDFYGRNMHAWIDCMRSIRSPEDGLSKIHIGKDELLFFRFMNFFQFCRSETELAINIFSSIGVVNKHAVSNGDNPIICYDIT